MTGLRPGEKIQYRFDGGLRIVDPYIFEFRCGAKGRWFKRGILEVFLNEFGMFPADYYKESIRTGTILVNGNKVEPTYLLRNGDQVIHKTHRHEPPVTAKEIEVIADTDDLLVVDKPATIPIHPCGSYRYNTLTSILTHSRPDLRLHLVYRLDRLVSGLTILAKSPEAANRVSVEVRTGQTQKVYLARVIGDFSRTDLFPTRTAAEEDSAAAAPLPEVPFEAWLDEDGQGTEQDYNRLNGTSGEGEKRQGKKKRKKAQAEEEEDGDEDGEDEAVPLEWRMQADGSVLVRTGIRCVSFKDGVYECSTRGKASVTVIRLRSYDGETSVVECRPVTGRTHQIRLHLQWLGFPIANDPNYGEDSFVQDYAQKYRLAEKEAHKDYRFAEGKDKSAQDEEKGGGGGEEEGEKQATAPEGESEEERIKRVCPHCAAGGLSHFRKQQLRHEGIWLHALRYRGKTWAFETPLPPWARDHGGPSASAGDGEAGGGGLPVAPERQQQQEQEQQQEVVA